MRPTDEELKRVAEEGIMILTDGKTIPREDITPKALYLEMKKKYDWVTYYYMRQPAAKDVLDAYLEGLKTEFAARTYQKAESTFFGLKFNAEFYIRQYKDDYPAGIREIGQHVNELLILYSQCQIANAELRSEKAALLSKESEEKVTPKLIKYRDENRVLREKIDKLTRELEGFRKETRKAVLIDLGKLKKKVTINNQGVLEHTYLGRGKND